MEKEAYKIIVTGRVQGVWFRKYTKLKADKLLLKGFVKNLKDGNVYIEIEGFSNEIQAFMDWLSIGSPLSKVVKVFKEKIEIKNYNYFDIRY